MNKHGLLFGVLLSSFCCDEAMGQKKPNILFICVDDLREIGYQGASVIKTPFLDNLSGEGVFFSNHYVQVPTSGASRASMLTGLMPSKRSDLSNEACRINLSNQKEGGVPETMFHHLRRNGYHTVAVGKVSHSADGYLYGYNASASTVPELPYSWDELLFDPGKWGTGWNAFFGYADGSNRNTKQGAVKPYECADVADEAYPDGQIASLSVAKIKALSAADQPFCLAVGFFKPHLPFTAPKRYWDLYDHDKIPLSPAVDPPKGVHLSSLHASAEFNQYRLGEEKASLETPVSDDYARTLRHAYFACVSYVDAQIGRLLATLDECGVADNTIVVVWGDHGWHLGDLRMWGKHTLFETALNSVLIIKAPGVKGGVVNRRIVSTLDIYPTLMELCAVPCRHPLDGVSMTSILRNPRSKAWIDCSVAYFNSGVSIRTPKYRYVQYQRNQQPNVELYNYQNDRFERENIAPKQQAVVRKLEEMVDTVLLKRLYR